MRCRPTFRFLLPAVLLAVPVFAQAGSPERATRKPNILFIMTDDLDSRMLETLLDAGLMPSLKRHIIERGTTFERSYVSNSGCCPTRATSLTGQYSHNTLVLSNKPPNGGVLAFDDSSTLATWLQDAGFYTGLIGKYLNGYPRYTPENHVPPGWDTWLGLIDPD
jgi:N-acetylglucosamine-6-sulfatase